MLNVNNDTINSIKRRGIRLTPQRKKIINVLLANKKQHLSAAEIDNLLKKKGNSIGMATIYRTLNLFEKKDIVVKRDFDNETAKYEITINQSQHNHLICKKCGKIIEISDMLPDNIDEILSVNNDFYYLNHCLKIYGYCKECQEKNIL